MPSGYGERVPMCMARPCVARRSVERANVKAASMYQTSGVEHLMLRARMGIRAHPTLTKRKTSKVSHIGTQSCGCAGQTVRPSPHSISQTLVGKLLNRSIFDVSLSFSHRGSSEAIPSEPPSLACPIPKDWRARVAEREGVHSLGEPERAYLMRHWA